MGNRAYTRTWLARQLGVDRKTLRGYLVEYEVGWPPFSQSQPYLLATFGHIIEDVSPEFSAAFGWHADELRGQRTIFLQGREAPDAATLQELDARLFEPVIRGRRDHSEWTSWIYDRGYRRVDVDVYLTARDGELRIEFR
jgi:PAS domain-containing protein